MAYGTVLLQLIAILSRFSVQSVFFEFFHSNGPFPSGIRFALLFVK